MEAEQNVTYLDEEILKKREEKKKEKHNSLEDGIYIKGQVLEFEQVQVSEKFAVTLPNTWKVMPEELARVKYPTEFRPQCILTNQDLSVNMGFSVFPHELKVQDVKKMAERVMGTISSENPGFRFFKFQELEKVNGYWFSFRSHAMDSDLFNQMLIKPVDNTIMMSNFNCLFQDSKDWEQTVLLIWESIEESKEEGDQEI